MRINTSAIFFFLTVSILTSCFGNENRETKQNNGEQKDTEITATVAGIEVDTIRFDKLEELQKYFSEKFASIESMKNRLRKELTDTLFKYYEDSLENVYYDLNSKRSHSILNYILEHEKDKESFNSLRYLLNWTVSSKVLDSIFHLFPAGFQNSPDGKWYSEKINKRNILSINSTYDPIIKGFEFWNTDGKMVKLGELSSRYILLDFWASWCIPCRHENRELMKQIESGLSRTDLSIVTVSLDDNKSKWIIASREDKLTSLNICDFKAWNSPLAKAFKVSTIPANVLINDEGKILAFNLGNDDLMNCVRSLP